MNIHELREELAELAGPEMRQTRPAREGVQERVRRTRRRQRATGALSTVLAAALVVGIVGVGLNGKDDGVQVRTTSPTTVAPGSLCRFGAKTAPQNELPPDVAHWAGARGAIGGGALYTPRAQNGFVHDGSIFRLKLGWWTIPWGIPKITARRLDGRGHAVGHGNEAIDQNGKWVASTIEFPSVGCWEITATYKHSTITFRRLVGPPDPLAVGTIAGVLQTVGGPAPGAPRAIAGSIQIAPRPTGTDAAIVTDARGRFTVDVPPGRYTIVGRSPQYQSGEFECQGGTITVRGGATTAVTVDCQID